VLRTSSSQLDEVEVLGLGSLDPQLKYYSIMILLKLLKHS